MGTVIIQTVLNQRIGLKLGELHAQSSSLPPMAAALVGAAFSANNQLKPVGDLQITADAQFCTHQAHIADAANGIRMITTANDLAMHVDGVAVHASPFDENSRFHVCILSPPVLSVPPTDYRTVTTDCCN